MIGLKANHPCLVHMDIIDSNLPSTALDETVMLNLAYF